VESAKSVASVTSYHFSQTKNLIININPLNPLNMNTEVQVLETLKQSEKPMNAGQIVEKTGLDRKVVDKAMTNLKKEEKIVSPVRCFWTAK
jgi:pimeloyl-CoA synthetase